MLQSPTTPNATQGGSSGMPAFKPPSLTPSSGQGSSLSKPPTFGQTSLGPSQGGSSSMPPFKPPSIVPNAGQRGSTSKFTMLQSPTTPNASQGGSSGMPAFNPPSLTPSAGQRGSDDQGKKLPTGRLPRHSRGKSLGSAADLLASQGGSSGMPAFNPPSLTPNAGQRGSTSKFTKQLSLSGAVNVKPPPEQPKFPSIKPFKLQSSDQNQISPIEQQSSQDNIQPLAPKLLPFPGSKSGMFPQSSNEGQSKQPVFQGISPGLPNRKSESSASAGNVNFPSLSSALPGQPSFTMGKLNNDGLERSRGKGGKSASKFTKKGKGFEFDESSDRNLPFGSMKKPLSSIPTLSKSPFNDMSSGFNAPIPPDFGSGTGSGYDSQGSGSVSSSTDETPPPTLLGNPQNYEGVRKSQLTLPRNPQMLGGMGQKSPLPFSLADSLVGPNTPIQNSIPNLENRDQPRKRELPSGEGDSSGITIPPFPGKRSKSKNSEVNEARAAEAIVAEDSKKQTKKRRSSRLKSMDAGRLESLRQDDIEKETQLRDMEDEEAQRRHELQRQQLKLQNKMQESLKRQEKLHQEEEQVKSLRLKIEDEEARRGSEDEEARVAEAQAQAGRTSTPPRERVPSPQRLASPPSTPPRERVPSPQRPSTPPRERAPSPQITTPPSTPPRERVPSPQRLASPPSTPPRERAPSPGVINLPSTPQHVRTGSAPPSPQRALSLSPQPDQPHSLPTTPQHANFGTPPPSPPRSLPTQSNQQITGGLLKNPPGSPGAYSKGSPQAVGTSSQLNQLPSLRSPSGVENLQGAVGGSPLQGMSGGGNMENFPIISTPNPHLEESQSMSQPTVTQLDESSNPSLSSEYSSDGSIPGVSQLMTPKSPYQQTPSMRLQRNTSPMTSESGESYQES